MPKKTSSNKRGLIARLTGRKPSSPVESIDEISQANAMTYGAVGTTVSSLLGSGKRMARDRQTIYQKWALMESDPICSTSMMLLCTTALGGHETSGQLIFVEPKPGTEKDKKLAKMVEDIGQHISPILNKVAFQMAYTGSAFGDSFARVYSDKTGVTDLYVDELVRPQLVQPFERGGRAIGYAVYVGKDNFERLDVTQMARLKMPRTQWVPQHGVYEKSLRMALREDDINKLPIMPAMAGGSLLYSAEDPYDNLCASLTGIVGQRWIDSIDEQMIGVNMESMTVDQQDKFLSSISKMLLTSKERADEAVKRGRPIMERVRHLIPIFAEKQLVNVMGDNQSNRASNISVEDIMLHARLLAGALGTDLSMLGFADQLSGGLGDGGFFRVSAAAAERARVIRVSLAEFFDQVIDIHTLNKYGVVFPASERPWQINFYGSISALEAEKQRTRADAMNSGMMLAQTMQAMKEMGASKDVMQAFLARTMLLDDDLAEMFSSIVDAKEDGDGDEGVQF